MEWINKFIEHLTISKTVSFALAVTSSVLLFGPVVFPGALEPLSKDWKVFAIAALVFSSVILSVSAARGIWVTGSTCFKRAIFSRRAKILTAEELLFIQLLGTQGNAPLNLTIMGREVSGQKMLERLALSKSLASKGLVECGPYDETIVFLTDAGRKRALDALRSVKGPSGA
jgi:hypothetical protein